MWDKDVVLEFLLGIVLVPDSGTIPVFENNVEIVVFGFGGHREGWGREDWIVKTGLKELVSGRREGAQDEETQKYLMKFYHYRLIYNRNFQLFYEFSWTLVFVEFSARLKHNR